MATVEDLVVQYQKKRDQVALNAVREHSRNIVYHHVNRFLQGPGHIPRPVMEAKADELLVQAADSFDPKAGASFTTHLFTHLRRLDRFTKANANVARTSEARAGMIVAFQNAMKELEDQKRRPPTDEELADHMSIPLTTIQMMRKTVRREVPWSQIAAPQEQAMERAKHDQVFDDIYYELTPDERVVFEHLLGRGRKQLSAGQDIAKATGFSQAKVSVLRTRIAERIKPYLGTQQRMPA